MPVVASRDSAFLWETEVLRTARRTQGEAPAGDIVFDDGDWLTLREASDATGVPTSTLRKWARHENIPSFLEKTPEGHLRMVSITGIEKWADEIGRHIESPRREATRETSHAASEIDLTAEEAHVAPPEVPEGSMLVPLDAWNRMLNQLGNLHEAGQQLAEARERAAKAETEALFLRERVRELRQEMEQRNDRDDEPSNQEEPPAPSTTSLLRKIYADWRRSRRRA